MLKKDRKISGGTLRQKETKRTKRRKKNKKMTEKLRRYAPTKGNQEKREREKKKEKET